MDLLITFAHWLNTTLPDSAALLVASRAFFTMTLTMTLWSGARLCARYPTVLAFWLATAPLPFVLLYFVAQIYATPVINPDATYGLLWVNTSLALAFAGYWTLLGMLRKLFGRVYA